MPQLTDDLKNKLVQAAIDTLPYSYSPYSNYAVSAALLTEDNQIYNGINVENRSYSMTICAERAAMCSAVSAGKTQFKALAIVTEKGVFPCGACRQFISEFNPELPLIIANARGEILRELSLSTIFGEGQASPPIEDLNL